MDLFGNPGELVSEEDALKAAQKMRLRVERAVKASRKASAPAADQAKPNKPAQSFSKPETPLYSSSAVEKSIAYNMQDNFSHSSRSSQQVMIKHKQTRQYDPEAVARLKEKLGISQQKKGEHEK